MYYDVFFFFFNPVRITLVIHRSINNPSNVTISSYIFIRARLACFRTEIVLELVTIRSTGGIDISLQDVSVVTLKEQVSFE